MTFEDRIETACARCGQVNRFPRTRLLDDPTCGRCKEKVFARTPVTVTDASWEREVAASPLPVLVDLWAPWCGPCRTIAPSLEQIARERAGRLKVAKVNIDENPGLAQRLGVRSIPTLVVLQGPREVDRLVGALPKDAIDQRLDRVVR